MKESTAKRVTLSAPDYCRLSGNPMMSTTPASPANPFQIFSEIKSRGSRPGKFRNVGIALTLTEAGICASESHCVLQNLYCSVLRESSPTARRGRGILRQLGSVASDEDDDDEGKCAHLQYGSRMASTRSTAATRSLIAATRSPPARRW